MSEATVDAGMASEAAAYAEDSRMTAADFVAYVGGMSEVERCNLDALRAMGSVKLGDLYRIAAMKGNSAGRRFTFVAMTLAKMDEAKAGGRAMEACPTFAG